MNFNLLIFSLLAFSLTSHAEVEFERRELKVSNFPCMKCHTSGVAKEIKLPLNRPHNLMTFKHMDSVKNCFSCHDKTDRNKLLLHTGEKISFNDSQRQCFQCHGSKKKDWELGIHGKTIGSWQKDGKRFLSCSLSQLFVIT